MTGYFELDVPAGLRRGAHGNTEAWISSAYALLDLVQRSCGLSDLAGRAVLDMGCGPKMTKALLERSVPISRYAGIDVNRDVIEFLQTNVVDPRFSFHHIDVRNDLYNPTGRPLQDRTDLPVGDERFDIIWLFSVFTHLDPADYRAMLRLLRPFVRDDGWLIFSLYVNESTQTGFGPVNWHVQRASLSEEDHGKAAHLIEMRIEQEGHEWFEAELRRQVDEHGVEWLARQIDASPTTARQTMQEVIREVLRDRDIDVEQLFSDDTSTTRWYVSASRQLRCQGEPPDFVDLIPSKPLMQPLYSRRHALELIEGTGWRVESLNPPEPEYIQHYFVCRPD